VADDQVIFYSKISPDRTDQLLLAVSLDPHAAHPVDLEVPLSELGIGPSDTYQVQELLTGERQLWQGPRARVLLTPEQPAAIWSVLRFAHRENSFDYYD
jgi:starch synthase (maltosyl-transferring)